MDTVNPTCRLPDTQTILCSFYSGSVVKTKI